MLALLGWHISESAATIIGSFLGAAASVYGAVFAVQQQAKDGQDRLKLALLSVAYRAAASASVIADRNGESSGEHPDSPRSPEGCLLVLNKLNTIVCTARTSAERLCGSGNASLESEEFIQRLIWESESLAADIEAYRSQVNSDRNLAVGKELVGRRAKGVESEFDLMISMIKDAP